MYFQFPIERKEGRMEERKEEEKENWSSICTKSQFSFFLCVSCLGCGFFKLFSMFIENMENL